MLHRFLTSSVLFVCSLMFTENSVASSFNIDSTPLASKSQTILAQDSMDNSDTLEKPRIAVIDLDFSSVGSPNLLSLIPGGADGVADILVTALVQGGKYTVVERSEIETILAEQNLGASGRISSSTAAEIGKILGVRAVIIGSVTQFDLQRQSGGGGVFGIGASTQDTDAEVAINARVIDTSTAEILYAIDGKGNQSQSDTQVSIFGVRAGSSTSNEGKLLTLATEQAVKEISDAMGEEASAIATLQKPVPQVDAIVANVSGSTIILNKGTNQGYRTGMTVSIERVTDEIKDPETGEILRKLTTQVAEVKLTDVDGKSSLGEIISGAPPKVGDVAKPMVTE